MFGALFCIGQQIRGVTRVLIRRSTALARACDRSNLDQPVHNTDVHFRRAANQRELAGEIKTKHVRRGIHETQTAVKGQRVLVEIDFKEARENELKYISALDIILCLTNELFELIAVGAASR